MTKPTKKRMPRGVEAFPERRRPPFNPLARLDPGQVIDRRATGAVTRNLRRPVQQQTSSGRSVPRIPRLPRLPQAVPSIPNRMRRKTISR